MIFNNFKCRWEKNILTAGCVFALSIQVLVSIITLNRFPAINFDETANAVMADEYHKTNRVRYPLMFNVVDPAFFDFTASGQEGLRGIYTYSLSKIQSFIGRNYLPLRYLSLFLWVLTGLLLFQLTKTVFGIIPAVYTITFWVFSFDAVLASHLIRPDIWLALFQVIMCQLMLSRLGKSYWRWAVIGLIGALSLGFHPHAIILVAWAFLGWIITRSGTKDWTDFSGLCFGTIIGICVFLLMIDIETIVIGNYSYVSKIYQTSLVELLERLKPWKLISDSVHLVAKPDSFYLQESLLQPVLWKCSRSLTFISYTFVWVFLLLKKRSDFYARFFLVGGVLMFLGVGYGHMRNELIYNLPLTLMILPLIGEFLSNKTIDRWLRITIGCSFVFVSSVTFYLEIYVTSKTAPVEITFEQTNQIIQTPPKKVLAPLFYWFSYGDSFRDINGLILDYFYSGQKRARSCVMRFQPDIMIVDEDFRKRFQVGFNKSKKQAYAIPLNKLLGVPCHYLGSIPANIQHSALDIYSFNWATESRPQRDSNP